MSGQLRRLIQVWSAVCLAIASTCASASDVPKAVYPRLVQRANGPDGFVPLGWKIELLRKGDLTGAKHEDLVMVLRQNDPRNIISDDGMCENSLDTNPRILAVAFARPDGSYALALENHTLIPRRESSCFDDALEEGNVSITHGTMNLTLHRFASTGTWEMGDATYTFRWQNQRFELIGYDDMSVMRNSGEISEISINFMTRKAKLSSGYVSKDSPNKVTWVKLGSSRRWTPDEIGQGSGFFGTVSELWQDQR
ncbi:hypothetical protein KDX16_13150 [Burkholderia vietnamiensis]|uniref:hypothetical protein n=1 Tax=Burkholderia vietnamiensis TaxID=60552 RepID=UPI000A6878E7|nr:hypothetical protein [Burkholderia vietnamiensis]MBR7916786.1 hypothetical protein [Burkholderia vietnamiensis]MBR8358178.1 hypothetical protein [Burkholderia vietnamiensis]MDN8036319.1 hypothetical protein [Burkholderia vietnamiensis]